MTIEFYAQMSPTEDIIRRLEDINPANPFYTLGYIKAQSDLGYKPCLLALRENNRLVAGCTAFIMTGRINTTLEITSMPTLNFPQIFWDGVLDFCKETKVTRFDALSFASPIETTLPTLPGETSRKKRNEYILDLNNTNLLGGLSSNHKRNIKRAYKASLQLTRNCDPQASHQHILLMRDSIHRRWNRGESVTENLAIQSFMRLIRNDSGVFFQAVRNGKVLSSVLVLLSSKGGYYHSAGTSPEGMSCGASHFLIYKIAEEMQEQQRDLFNLGGDDREASGLARFKSGFGTTRIHLESGSFFLGSKVKKTLGQLAQSLKNYGFGHNWSFKNRR